MNRRILSLLLAALTLLGLLAGCGDAAPDRSVLGDPGDQLQLIVSDSGEASADKPSALDGDIYYREDGSYGIVDEDAQEDLLPPALSADEAIDEPEPVDELEAVDELEPVDEPEAAGEAGAILEDGEYTAPQDVADYIHLYGHLPSNFITKNKARDLGWDSSRGNLWDVAPGKSIGGDRFGNYEGLLPEGTRYTECDVNYQGGYRGGERIIFGKDGTVWYTDDHYNSFTQLY